MINRAPVLTLWATVVAERLGFDRNEALTLGRAVPAVQTPEGLRALSKDKPIQPESVWRYLKSTFVETLDEAYHAMSALGSSLSAHELSERGFKLYEQFRLDIPSGPGGWGVKGRLDLDTIRALVHDHETCCARGWRSGQR
jgi:hypothetical protein